jgi:threonine dehydratase
MAASDVSRAVTAGQIARCEALIRPYIRRTPVMEIDAADIGLKPGKLSLKLELFQYSGSFKARGAFANLLSRKVPAAGVVAASGGNHGAAVAYAAMRLKTPAKIFVPSVSSPAKVQRIREYGADLVVEGDRYADALAASEAWAQRTGAMPVHAFDQEETILGQGTIGLEFDEQISGFDTLLVSVGGGGLIAGLAAWYAGRIKVIGVEPSASPTLTKALEAGHPVDAEAGGLAADSLAPKRVGERVFPIVRDYVRETVLVSDEAISQAQHMLWNALRIVAEPGGAAAFSAVLSGAYRPQDGERVGIVISGGNTTAVDFDLAR